MPDFVKGVAAAATTAAVVAGAASAQPAIDPPKLPMNSCHIAFAPVAGKKIETEPYLVVMRDKKTGPEVGKLEPYTDLWGKFTTTNGPEMTHKTRLRDVFGKETTDAGINFGRGVCNMDMVANKKAVPISTGIVDQKHLLGMIQNVPQ